MVLNRPWERTCKSRSGLKALFVLFLLKEQHKEVLFSVPLNFLGGCSTFFAAETAEMN